MKSRHILYAIKIRERVSKGETEFGSATLHVLCCSEMRAAPNLLIFGIGGDLTESERAPFVIFKDGRGDYGSYCEDYTRYFQTNFREKTIKQGELFSVEAPDEDSPQKVLVSTYEITEIHALT